MIARIDAGPLLGEATAERRRVDEVFIAAATSAGFVTLAGLPAEIAPTAVLRADLKRLFGLAEADKRSLTRRKFVAANPNVYRGWFPAQAGAATYKEGIDLGPDLAVPGFRVDAADPLTEPTPLPGESQLPLWRAAAARYYLAMQRLADALVRSLARGLELPEHSFAPLYISAGLSTLRLIRYPERTAASLVGAPQADTWVTHRGVRRHTLGIAHVDTGCMTLLAQDGIAGLQACTRDGEWLDVPPEEGSIVVNFGALLERWTGGRIRATAHRILGSGCERHAIAFFYEPAVDALICPLPLAGAPRFEPFPFGDYLWALVTRFVEFEGLEDARRPLRIEVARARQIFATPLRR